MKKLLLVSLCFYSLVNYSQNVSAVSYATGFSSALAIEHPPGDSRLFIVQQGGLIRIVNTAGVVNTTPFLNLSTLTTGSGERGLLGLAFHPNYATNGWFFVNYTNLSGNTVIARYSVSSTNPDVADPTGLILMTIDQPASNHNGGTLRFGPDGYLYIGMGDGGGGGDTSGYAQNLDMSYPAIAGNLSRIYLGKMLRIDVDNPGIGILNYGIPPTNPYVGQSGKEEIWAYGLRNPWKFSFNRLNGDLWIADVGQGSVEEINKIASPLPTALNFGWRCFEGSAPYSSSIGTCPAYAATVPPIAEYSSATGSRCSVTGGYFYTGTANPNFQNKYFFADYCTGEIAYANAAGAITWAYDSPGTVTSLGEDMNGELYYTTGSIVYRLIDTLGATEFEKSGFSVYPNPTNETFFIKSTTGIFPSKVELYDLTGKLLLTQQTEASAENSIAVSTLAAGMYAVTIEDTNGNRYSTKLMIK